MFTALACDNWTIFSTLVTGAVAGMFILLGGVALIIHSENQERRRQQKERSSQQPVGQRVGANPFVAQD